MHKRTMPMLRLIDPEGQGGGSTPPTGPKEGESQQGAKTFTQDEVNSLVGQARADERRKATQRYADYDDLKVKAGEVATAEDRIAELERKYADAETMLLPFHVVIIPQYILFNNLGMINTFWPLLLGKFLAAEAFFVFLVVQFMRGIPKDLDEAAAIDGAGHFRVFATVILPLSRPALLTAGIFTFINAWNDFLGPLLYLKQPDLYTLPVAMRLFVDQTTSSDYGAQIAMAVFALIPVLIFFFIFQRYLVEGVSTSGLKG